MQPRDPCRPRRGTLRLMSIELVMPSTISSSVVPFSSHLQLFPASGSFQMSQFTSGGQSIGVSASASVLLMNIQATAEEKAESRENSQNATQEMKHKTRESRPRYTGPGQQALKDPTTQRTVLLPGIRSDIKTHVSTKLGCQCVGAFPKIAPNWKQSKYPSRGRWANTRRTIHTRGQHLVISVK